MSTLDDFLASIKEVKWFSESGELPSGCVLFDSMGAALAADDGTLDTNWYTARADNALAGKGDALDAAHAAWGAVFDAAEVACKYAPWNAIRYAARDASLLAGCIASWNDPTEETTVYALKRWSVWTAGYGLLREANGMLYCYGIGKWIR